MEQLTYLNLPECYRLTNGTVDVIVTTAVGPRIISYGFTGSPNMLGEFPDVVVPTGLGNWKPIGGHRLWVAPEQMPASYAPDQTAIDHAPIGEHGIRLTQPVDAAGIEKRMAITLGPDGTEVTIKHMITNRGHWPIEVAPWAITIVRNGITILPQEPFRSHDEALLPVRPLVVWSFTNLTDPRWKIGKKYIVLRPDEALSEPQKIGIGNKQGWSAYHRDRMLFVKRFAYDDGARYPDFGSNNETYAAGAYMEVETLGPLQQLDPGDEAEHIERWYLFNEIDLGDTEESWSGVLEPLIAQTT